MKKVLRIFNIILCGISALAIILIFATPVFKFQLKSINGELVANLLSEKSSVGGGSGGLIYAEEISSPTEKEDVDIKAIVEKYVKNEDGSYRDFKFKNIAIELKMSTISDVKKAEAKDRVEVLFKDIFEPLINNIINDPTLKQIIRDVAKELSKTVAKSTVTDQIFKNLVKDENKQNNAYLEAAGINDQFIEGQIDNLFEALFPEDPETTVTVDSVAEAVVTVLSETMGKLNEAANSDDPEIAAAYAIFAEGGEAYISDEELADLQTEISTELGNMLTELALADEETGEVVSMDDALSMLVEAMLDENADNPIAKLIRGETELDTGSGEGEGEGEGEGKSSLVLRRAHYAEEVDPSSSEAEPVDPDQKEEEDKLTKLLSDKLWALISGSIFGVDPNADTSSMSEAELAEYNAKLVKTGETVGQVVGYAQIAMFAFAGLWGLLFLTSLIRIFAKNKPYKYMGFFYWFFLVVFGIVELVFGVLLFAPALLGITAIQNLIGEAAKTIALIGISLYSSLSATWVLNTILFFFSIPYAVIGHKVKKQYKTQKRAAKIAQAS